MIQNLITLAYFLTLVGLPIFLAWAIGQKLRVRDHIQKMAIVLCTVAFSLVPFINRVWRFEQHAYQNDKGEWVSAEFVAEGIDTRDKQAVVTIPLTNNQFVFEEGHPVLSTDKKVRVHRGYSFQWSRASEAVSYGIDLAGGTNLVYQMVDTPEAPLTSETVNRMIAAVNRRINPSGTKEVVVRQVGRDRIEVIVPGANPAAVADIKEQITRLGTLEFCITAYRESPYTELVDRAMSTPNPVSSSGSLRLIWRPIAPKTGKDGRPEPSSELDGHITRQIPGKPPGFKEVLLIQNPKEDYRITGKYLTRSNPTSDDRGSPAVGFHFNQRGAYLFSNLTTANSPTRDGRKRHLAVLLDNQVHTAPSINGPIGADGIIQGQFTMEEVNKLVGVLNAGALPIEIQKDPISEFTVSPTLGADVQSKGKLALFVSTLAVVIFMGVYYLLAGAVANFAMLFNLLLILASMSFIDAAFTLPGLAGLVLSAGMAVDANVLIYERIREETQRGASLRMAIHNGFDKAFTAIFDSNITTLITSAILYFIGTDQVKGFAVALFIGLMMNMFTAVYVSRVILEVFERGKLIKKLHMLSLIGVTKIDFVGKQAIAITCSVILIAIGLFAFVQRQNDIYDIDFTGGTMVSMVFNTPQETDKVREKLQETMKGSITLEELTRATDSAAERGKRFRLRTTNASEAEVAKIINDTFGDALLHVSLKAAAIEAIPEPEKASGVSTDIFPGGHRLDLAFSSEIAIPTVTQFFSSEIKKFTNDGKPKYPQGSDLLSFEGVTGSGMTSRSGTVRLYDKLRLSAAKELSKDDLATITDAVAKKLESSPVFDEQTTFASSVASETKASAVLAILLSLVSIVAYVWFRFERLVYGMAAVVALAHDVLVTLGCVALSGWIAQTPIGQLLMITDFKIDLAMIAAFLTIVGYSINDTIVIFDRLREIKGKNPIVTKDMINLTVNQTLSRTILTATTVFLSVLILYVLGGEGIHGFAFSMVIGAIAGTYSTVYIASPLVLFFMDRFAKEEATRAIKRDPALSKA